MPYSYKRSRKNPSSPETKRPFFDKDNTSRAFFRPSQTPIQTKLTIGKPGDAFEREADAVADRVVNQPTMNNVAPGVQRQDEQTNPRLQMQDEKEEEVATKPQLQMQDEKEEEVATKPQLQMQDDKEEGMQPQEEEEVATKPQLQMQDDKEEEVATKPQLQMQDDKEEEVATKPQLQMQDDKEEEVATKPESQSQSAGKSLTSQLQRAKGQGDPLPKATLLEMGKALGQDFSTVRIHTDQMAVDMNQQLKSQAFTHGQDIYFNQGKFDPESKTGKQLLAHELTHVVQQNKK
ncbi:MAG: DUF4157 domain-containing protein [Mastigocoleus sp. MO_167.B18]|nr:DUF4157 domain-containing protein [Mastigocoleus sp. MO_167.B18]